jgi:hypothetical protein
VDAPRKALVLSEALGFGVGDSAEPYGEMVLLSEGCYVLDSDYTVAGESAHEIGPRIFQKLPSLVGHLAILSQPAA